MLTYVFYMFLICSTKVDFDEDTFDDIGFRMILDQILWEIEKSYVQLDKSPIVVFLLTLFVYHVSDPLD